MEKKNKAGSGQTDEQLTPHAGLQAVLFQDRCAFFRVGGIRRRYVSKVPSSYAMPVTYARSSNSQDRSVCAGPQLRVLHECTADDRTAAASVARYLFTQTIS